MRQKTQMGIERFRSMQADSTSRSIRRHMMLAGLLCLVVAGGSVGWAANTKLAGAVVASGNFVVESSVKDIKHATGGIVGDILVEEGERVNAGDLLLSLDSTQLEAEHAILSRRLAEMTARQARLRAERDDLPEIELPDELSSGVARSLLVEGERGLFEFRRQSRESRKEQLRERIAQYENEITGLKAQQDAFERALSVVDKELRDLRNLLGNGLVSVQRVNELDREAATLSGEKAEAIAAQAQAAGRIAEARLQILQIDQDFKTEVASELRELEAAIAETEERILAVADQLSRVEIVSPRDGFVHHLSAHTIGGVVSPAETILQIVPDSDEIALDVQIEPRHIDRVGLGQTAVVRLSGVSAEATPEVDGTVIRIAADLSRDEATGVPYYLVRIRLNADDPSLDNGLLIVPGMPAEVFINTGERTALSYLVKPMTDKIMRAFREE